LPYSDRLKILALKLLNGDVLFMIWFLFTRCYMDVVMRRYLLHLQIAQHVVLALNF